MRKCIREDGVPLTPSQKSKRYRDKKKIQFLQMKKYIEEIEKSKLIHSIIQKDN